MQGIIVLFLCFLSVVWSDITEPKTKHAYASKDGSYDLAGVGVRVKQIGPLKVKVYSAAIYLEKSATTVFLKKLGNKNKPEESISESSLSKKIVLKMARTVGSDAMSDALADVVRPRMKSDAPALKSFQAILAEGLKDGGATNNMKLSFTSAGGKMTVDINGAKKGEVKSASLCDAFAGVYLDKSGVSPSLKESVRKTLLSWCS